MMYENTMFAQFLGGSMLCSSNVCCAFDEVLTADVETCQAPRMPVLLLIPGGINEGVSFTFGEIPW